MCTIKTLITNLVNQKRFPVLFGNAVDITEKETYSIAEDTDRLSEREKIY
jgi:hypothetical protein